MLRLSHKYQHLLPQHVTFPFHQGPMIFLNINSQQIIALERYMDRKSVCLSAHCS